MWLAWTPAGVSKYSDENPRVSGQGLPGQIWRTCAARRGRRDRRRGGEAAGSSAARSSSRRRFMPADEAKAAASSSPRTRRRPTRSPRQILGMTLVTHQTGPGRPTGAAVLVEETLPIAKELYARHRARPRIGKLGLHGFGRRRHGNRRSRRAHAGKDPERDRSSPGIGLTPFQARKLAFGIGIPAPASMPRWPA